MAPRSKSLRFGLALVASGALVFVAACSSSPAATTAPASTAPGASTAAGSSSAPITSTAPASSVPGASIAIPAFSFPSDDKGLEALLPSTMCGQPATKLSMTGSDFAADADPAFIATLSQLGKSVNDVAVALATGDPVKAPDCNVNAGVFEVKGADGGQLQSVFLAASAASETTYTKGNVGGRDVYIDASDPTNRNYAYFKGDGIFFVTAPDDATAAPILSAMP